MHKILSLLLAIFSLAGCSLKPAREICINNNCVRVEIADTQSKREKGLMFRRNLPAGEGMLFVYPAEGIYGTWMKNMFFPIDIIWIDKDERVADIYENALPCKDACEVMIPDSPVKFALELNSGFVARFRVKAGDKVSLRAAVSRHPRYRGLLLK